MMPLSRYILLTLTLLYSVEGTALSGNELSALCKEINQPRAFDVNSSVCVSYIEGAIDGWRNALANSPPPPAEMKKLSMCLRNDITRRQVAQVVLKFMQDNPAYLQEPASTVVSRAIISAFPCK